MDSVEDPGQGVSLLNAHFELDDYGDDASLSDAAVDGDAVAETALDSPPATTAPSGVGDRREFGSGPTPTTSGWRPPPSTGTGVKEAPQNALKLPLDQTDYLQPQSSLPATYLDLVASPGKRSST